VKAVLFDLDNTLYDTQQYFIGAFESISKYVSSEYDLPEQKIYKTLGKLWQKKTSMYPYLFNDLLKLLQIKQDNPEVIDALVRLFNGYAGNIELYPDVLPTLQELRGRLYKLGIITDGTVERQKRKIELLKLEPLFDVIIYTKEIESKASPTPFLAALARLNVKAPDAYYIADNPLIDFKGAKKVGIKTIRILRGEYTKIPRNEYIDFEVEKLEELLEIIEVKV
jgi:putative hydrolase of the HAD superfamily